MANFVLTGRLDTLREECSIIATLPMLHNLPATPPLTFTPTRTQMLVKHGRWIDSVPCPQLRDNLIIASTTSMPASTITVEQRNSGSQIKWDEDALRTDICGGIYEGFDDCAQKGLLVWGDPWVVTNWEISPGFLRKWGFLVRGCVEMIDATNRWRDSWGEDPLIFEVE